MPDETQVALGQVQQTLFFPLLARARETESRRPLLSDPKAVELAQAIDFDTATFQSPMRFIVLIRTMILDWWVRQFLAEHPAGTVVELGTGLNTRFERTDNGSVHWIDLDLPDTIELRRRYFADTGRRRMLAASLLDEDWLSEVESLPGPYFFVSDGVLVYLREEEATGALARIATRFPGSSLAFDTYPLATFKWEHKMAAKRGLALWQWPCDDPCNARAPRPAPARIGQGHPPARWPARGTARQVPLPAAAGRPGFRPGHHAEPVPRGPRALAVRGLLTPAAARQLV